MNDVMPYITLFCQWRQRRNDDAQTLLPLPPFLGVWYQEPAREPRGVGPSVVRGKGRIGQIHPQPPQPTESTAHVHRFGTRQCSHAP